MSTEWYLQAHSNDEEQFISCKKIQSILSAYPNQKEEACVVVALPEGDVDFYVDLTGNISGLMISRPIKSSTLDRIIYEVMQCVRFIFFTPDAKFPIVLCSEVIEHLPEEMLASLGKPQIADSPETFSCLLQEMYE